VEVAGREHRCRSRRAIHGSGRRGPPVGSGPSRPRRSSRRRLRTCGRSPRRSPKPFRPCRRRPEAASPGARCRCPSTRPRRCPPGSRSCDGHRPRSRRPCRTGRPPRRAERTVQPPSTRRHRCLPGSRSCSQDPRRSPPRFRSSRRGRRYGAFPWPHARTGPSSPTGAARAKSAAGGAVERTARLLPSAKCRSPSRRRCIPHRCDFRRNSCSLVPGTGSPRRIVALRPPSSGCARIGENAPLSQVNPVS
jgi:hypothetical protein